MILLYTNNMINCCQSLNGLENINADSVIADIVVVDNIDVETEFTSLQTQIDNLAVAVSNGGGYFVLTCEFAGNPVNQGRFAFGGSVNTTSNLIKTTMPNCSLIACRFELSSSLTTTNKTNVVIEKNGVAISGGSGNFLTGEVLKYLSVANGDFTAQSFIEGDTFNARYNNNGLNTFTGTATGARASFVFQTNAVNGQNVSFLTPTLTSLQPSQTAYLTDSITTANNTQTHQLAFGIPRGKSVSAVLGSVSSGSASVSTTTTTDVNGNDTITFNFVLQPGNDGARGDKGDTGDRGANGNADPVVLVVAAAAGGSAGGAAGGSAGGIAGASAGSSAGASSGTTAATNIFNSLVDPRLQDVELKTYNMIVPANVLAQKTTIGGTTIELYPTGTLYLGGQVFGSGNTTDNINMLCNGGLIVNSGSSQFINVVEMLNDLNIAGDLDVEGQVNIIEDLTCLSNITLNSFLLFNNGSVYDSATIQVIPSVNPTQNNTGTMTINSQFLNIQSELILLQDDQTNPPDYPFIKFDANNFIGNNLYGSITCDTTTAPAVNNGGDFTFACNQLITSNDLTVNGDLQVVGNFNINNLAIDNLTINNELKISVINQLDDNLVLEIGKDTNIAETELFIKSETVYIFGYNVDIGSDTLTNTVALQGDSLSLGENESCGIIDIGNVNDTIITIRGDNLGVNSDVISIGQAGTSTLVSLRAEEIDIGDADTNLIKIGRYNDYISPIEVKIGNDAGGTDLYGFPLKLLSQDIRIGDPTTTGDVLTILTNTNNIGTNSTILEPVITTLGNQTSISNIYGSTVRIGSNNSIDVHIKTGDNIKIGDETKHGTTTTIDTQVIDIGTNGSGAYPVDITIGSDTSTTDIYGDIITIGDANSQNSTQILSDICNILTNGTSIRPNTLDMGSNYTTTANLTGQSITLLGTNTTTLRGDTINIGNDNSTDTIQIGNSLSYTEIEGSQINMGVGSVLNTINIGNAFSVVNIQGNQNNAINVAGMFFDQIGF